MPRLPLHYHFSLIISIMLALPTLTPAQAFTINGAKGGTEPYVVAANAAAGIDTNGDFGFGDAAKVERLFAADDEAMLYVFAEGSLHSSNRLFILIDSDANEATGWSGAHPNGTFGEADALEFFTDVANGGWDLAVVVEGFGNPTEQIYLVALAYNSNGTLADEQYIGNIMALSGELSHTVRGASATIRAGITPGDAADNGIELAIPRAWLAGGALPGQYRLAALNGNNTNNFWSNSTIPDNPYTGLNNIGFDPVDDADAMEGLTAPVWDWATAQSATPTPTPTLTVTTTPTPTPIGPTPTPSPTPTPGPTPGSGAITIGAGPAIGSTAGVDYFEEFQDWRLEDCRALDPYGDTAALNDGGDNARDLIALYSRDEAAGGSVFFRVDVLDNFFQAENGSLDVYLLLDLGTPNSGATVWPDGLGEQVDARWEVALAVYGGGFWNVYDAQSNVLSSQDTNAALFLGAYFHGDLDAVEFGIARSVLTGQGWDGSSPIRMQAGTAKDFTGGLRDALPNIGAGAASTADQSPTAKYAFILHGNQAISPAAGIQDLIWNETIRTPNDRPTGYRRALETARVFGAAPNIHVSATLVASALWADRPGDADPQDGPEFVDFIREMLDGSAANGEGAIVWGVFSEHIMPFFEGLVNQDSIALNDDYLEGVFDLAPHGANSIFWIPERVVRGSTFADLSGAGYGWTILDQTQHLREWFGENGQGHKIHRINGVNCFMINDLPDRFKFANTDGGLYIETRRHLVDMARAADQEQITVVFDDWEAYAGRSFLSFNTGSDNPDNFNTNVRWLANHPWVQIVTLEEAASWGWTPVDHGMNAGLPFETYDFLDYATEQSYENWYKGSATEQDFDGFQPFIREDLNQRTVKPFGALQSYVDSTSGAVGGAGTIAEDVIVDLINAPDNALEALARHSYSTAIFETAWHDEDSAFRCGDIFCAFDCDGSCEPDPTFDNIAGFARQLQFLNLRRTGLIIAAAEWAAVGNGGVTTAEAVDLDHDAENEYVLKNDRVFAVFENDGGRLIAAFARNPQSGQAAQMIGNLVGFPDRDDEREADTNAGARRVSALSDWFAAGPDSNQYVNGIYAAAGVANGWRFTSGDGNVEKTITLAPDAATLDVAYDLDGAISTLYVRNGLAPDPLNLMRAGQFGLQMTDAAGRLTLSNIQSGAAVSLDYADAGHNAAYNAAAGDGTVNSPRNMALLHMAELSGAGQFAFGLTFAIGPETPDDTNGWLLR